MASNRKSILKRPAILVLALLALLPGGAPAATPFIRGDANGDSFLDISDAVKILLLT